MKFRWDKKYLYWGITAFLVIAASILFYYLLFHSVNIKYAISGAINISMPIIYGLVLAYLMTPIVNMLERKLFLPFLQKRKKEVTAKGRKRMRLLSVILTVAAVILIVYLFLAMVIPQLIISIQNIALQFPQYVNNLERFVTNLLDKNPDLETSVTAMLNQYSEEMEAFLNSKVLPQLNEMLTRVSGTVFTSVVGFLRALWNFIIGMIVSVYLLFSKELFAGQSKKVIYAIFDRENANEVIRNIRFVNRTFGGYINGKLVDSLIIGLLCFIGMTLIQLPYAMLISVIVGVTNIIPFFGPYIGAIPSTLLILMVNPKQAFYFVIFILILQQLDGNFLGPKIVGNKTGLSSFWVIFSITVLGGYWGVLGMAIGVPIFAVFYAAVRALTERSLKRKHLSTNTEDYLNLSEIKNNEYIEILPPDDTESATISVRKRRKEKEEEEKKSK